MWSPLLLKCTALFLGLEYCRLEMALSNCVLQPQSTEQGALINLARHTHAALTCRCSQASFSFLSVSVFLINNQIRLDYKKLQRILVNCSILFLHSPSSGKLPPKEKQRKKRKERMFLSEISGAAPASRWAFCLDASGGQLAALS